MKSTTALIEYSARSKSVELAFFLWFFFGTIGAHRMYLGKRNGPFAIAVGTLALIIAGLYIGITPPPLVLIVFPISFVWSLIDAFSIPRWTTEFNIMVMNDVLSDRKPEPSMDAEQKAYAAICVGFAILVAVLKLI